jgi:hypothetical protein
MRRIVFPLAPLIKLCKDYGVLSLVDAAHAIGQGEVDVKAVDPDFWISVRLPTSPLNVDIMCRACDLLILRTATNGCSPLEAVRSSTFPCETSNSSGLPSPQGRGTRVSGIRHGACTGNGCLRSRYVSRSSP